MKRRDQNAVLKDALGVRKPLPLVPLGLWPSPVEALSELGTELAVDLWVKRDDLGGAQYGGNKVRKLEFLLGAARQRGCRSVITVGGVGSNQVVGTAIYAGQLGMETHAVVFPQPVTPEVRQSLERAAALGVRLVPLPDPDALPEVLERVCAEAPAPYELIPAGGSSPAGNLGYVAAAVELAAQIEAGLLPEPGEIYVALGSGGTLAGLALGCRLMGLRPRVVGVRVAPEDVGNAAVVERQIAALAGLLRRIGARVEIPADVCFEVVDDQFGEGYGMPTEASERARKRTRELASIELDATYAAKAMAALLERGAEASGERCVLFWNTGNSRDLAGLPPGASPRQVPAEIEAWLERDAIEPPAVS